MKFLSDFIIRSYALQTPSVKSIWDMGLHILRESFEKNADVMAKLINALLEAIERER